MAGTSCISGASRRRLHVCWNGLSDMASLAPNARDALESTTTYQMSNGVAKMARTIVKRAAGEPYAAGISPEFSSFNEGLKADLLRKLLRIGLISGGAGAGLGLLSHLVGKSELPRQESDDPDVDFPYPQLKTAMSPIVATLARPIALALTETGIGVAHGATRNHKDPAAGALYGMANGLGKGCWYGPGISWWRSRRRAS